MNNISIPWWLVVAFIIWMLSSLPTLLALVAYWQRRTLWFATTRWFLIAGLLALPFTICYTAGAIEDALRRDYPMLIYAVLMLGHLCLCACFAAKPNDRSA
jgi:cytochrome bd-type quinol oxidase subunit 1